MAALPVDPRTLNSWEDAFQYPLPVVRKLEQQLRQNIDENRQKLRSLVGASYRDLLGTADRIIEMDEQVHVVETNLVDIGRKANARAVERAGENHARMRDIRYARDMGKHRAIAQTKVLQSALSVASRTIKAGGDPLLAAKLVVLARLLHKSVSDSSEAPKVLEELRRKLTTLRKKLMSYVERVLVRPTTDKSTMVNPLCAYALITSSTPKDALRHFLQARYEQLESRSEDVTPENLIAMIKLYGQTLSDTRELFPRRFAEGLAGLGKLPLMRDAQIRETHELSLDVYDTWIAEDVRTFMPWLRYDQLTAAEITDGLARWGEQAQRCLLHALSECLTAQSDARAILNLRQEVLIMYLGLSSRLQGGVDSQAVQGVREVFLGRLTDLGIAATTIEGSSVVGLDKSTKGDKGQGMWDLAREDMDSSGGAFALRHAVIESRHGHDTILHTILAELDAWMDRINHFWETIGEMRSTRWMDELDDDVDDLLDGTPQVALSKRDPEQLQERLRQASTSALDRLYDQTRQIPVSSDHAASLLRFLRELDQRRNDLSEMLSLTRPHTNMNNLIHQLHESIAFSVLDTPVRKYTEIAKKRQSALAVASLWDGTPPLPIQPSPRVYRLVTSVHKAMMVRGTDIWSPAAVGVLKTTLSEGLQNHPSHSTDASPDDGKPLMNGHSETGSDSQEATVEPKNADDTEKKHLELDKDYLTQTLFDILWLLRVASSDSIDPEGSSRPGLQSVIDRLRNEVAVDAHSYQRMQKSANEYWKRTYLLFGLLAPGGMRT